MAKKNVKFQLNTAGVRELMKGPEMTAACQEKAREIMGRLGDGYETSTFSGSNRANVSIMTATRKARNENLKHNTILKALGV